MATKIVQVTDREVIYAILNRLKEVPDYYKSGETEHYSLSLDHLTRLSDDALRQSQPPISATRIEVMESLNRIMSLKHVTLISHAEISLDSLNQFEPKYKINTKAISTYLTPPEQDYQ